MSDKLKNIIMTVCFVGFILTFFFICLFKEPDEISVSERRKLAQKPEITVDSVLSGKAAEEFEDYAVDQFPFRESFRRLKAVLSQSVFLQKDNNGIYVADGYVSKIEYPLNEKSVLNAALKFTEIYEKYFKDGSGNAFYAVIPDKNYFLAEENGYPHLDYERLLEIMGENVQGIEYIDIFDCLELDDYYKTDTHWSQDKLEKVVQKIADALGVSQYLSGNYEVKSIYPFYGVYAGQSALNLPPDTLYYLTNSEIESATVYNYENGKTTSVYDLEKESGLDMYEVFLSGSVPLITIENPNAESGKELVIFRDSFGSSITPLLIEGYEKITLVDIRYISSDSLEQYIELGDQDVLFLYNTQVINNSVMLR